MTYVRTHPWISFNLDLRRASWQLWVLAGEAVSKCDHVAGTALRPEAARELMQVYLAKGAMATTAIEGNTLTEDQVRARIEGTLKLPPSKEYLGVEIDNIVKASNQIGRDYLAGNLGRLTPELIGRFNKQVLDGLILDAHIRPGKLRTFSVGVSDYRGAPHDDLDELLVKLCDWLDQPWIADAQLLPNVDHARLEAVIKAIIAHIYIAWIHPFGDGNGRTARLIEFFILIRSGVPFPAAHLLSNHYNETRSDYYRELSYSSKSGGDVMQFCLYAMRGFVDQLREQIGVIREQQLTLFWQNHVHQTLGETETGRRRRYLVLDLANSPEPVDRDKLTEISVRVLKRYVNKHERTLLRDLEELERLDLVEKVKGNRFRARTEVVAAYMPPQS